MTGPRPRGPRLTGLLVLCTAVALTIAACGDGDSADPSTARDKGPETPESTAPTAQAGTSPETAGDYEGPGTMTVAVAGELLTVAGTCTLEGDLGRFISTDGQSTVTLQTGDVTVIAGGLMIIDDDSVVSWFLQPGAGDYEAERTPTGMTFEGLLSDAGQSDLQTGTVEIACG